MSYVALYRMYRPQKFSDVVGQEQVTRTLRNALKNDKVAHAYLFSGPRGTGKTTIAKILAKAVNCEHSPIDDPCNECEICTGINKNMISDVIEIDAASNNGIDEIREIRDKVKYLPSRGKYKVYIIDEVHMLSTSAFNALLKTLEEPPKHVIFILATTEAYKIPSTILSRCQRFDFKALSVKEISGKIFDIVKQEKIEITDEAIEVIAENAEGGMRDALSLLDQVISYSNDMITAEDVHKVSGSVSSSMITELINNANERNSAFMLKTLDDLINEGKEISRIISDMIYFLRNLLVYKNIKNENFNQVLFTKNEFISCANSVTNPRIYYYINILNEAQNSIKWTNQKKEFLEFAFIKMCDDNLIKPVEENELLYELDRRLKKIEDGSFTLNSNSNNRNSNYESIEVNSTSNSDSNIYQTKKESINLETSIEKNRNEILIKKILSNLNNEKKELLLKGWVSLARIEDIKQKNVALILNEGELVAMDDYNMIVLYDEEYQCSLINKESNKEIIRSILNRKTHLIDDYVALTRSEYNDIMKQWNSSHDLSLKREELPIENNASKEEDIELSLLETFGKDKVKIK